MNGAFFSSDGFMPQGHSYLWQPEILWLHAISDILVFLSLLIIPILLLAAVRKYPHFHYKWLIGMFAFLLFLCGLTHFADVWTIWRPHYGIAGMLKAVTAAVAIATTALFIPLAPRAIHQIANSESRRDEKNNLDAKSEK